MEEKKNLDLPIQVQAEPLWAVLEAVEKQIILLALQKNHWNISRTSKQLAIKRQSLQYRMKKYGIK
jgi:arginine utilization regulatory protein